MTKRLLPLSAAMKALTSARSSRPWSESAESCSPVIQPSVRSSSRSTSAEVSSSSMVRVRNSCASEAVKRRSAARSSVSCPRLRSLARGSGGSARVVMSRREALGQVVHEERHRPVDVGRLDDVVVVEHEDPHLVRALVTRSGQFVDERAEQGGVGGGVQRVDDGGVEGNADGVEGRHEVRHQPREVVVGGVEGQPADTSVWPALGEVCEPVADDGGLAEARRRGHQRHPMTWVERGVESCGQSSARSQLQAPGWREQLGRKDRHRHCWSIGRLHPDGAGEDGRARRRRPARRGAPAGHLTRRPAQLRVDPRVGCLLLFSRAGPPGEAGRQWRAAAAGRWWVRGPVRPTSRRRAARCSRAGTIRRSNGSTTVKYALPMALCCCTRRRTAGRHRRRAARRGSRDGCRRHRRRACRRSA